MSKSTIAIVVFGLLLSPTIACRIDHLGEDHGVAYRRALHRQHTAGQSVAPMSADDAKATMAEHRDGRKDPDTRSNGRRGAPSTRNQSTLGPSDLSSSTSSSGSSSSGGWGGSDRPISLDAK
jgi:hypothetical protein